MECAYSTNLILAPDKLSCVNSNCSDPNCLVCYNDGANCSQCKSGYELNDTCEASTCSVANCLACSVSVCASCAYGYSLSADQTIC